MKNKKPEIRFKGFSEEWEEKELGAETKIIMGQSPNGENYTDNPLNHILVQGNADMKNGIVVPRIWTKQVTKTANPDDLIFTVRAPVGDIGKTDYNVVIGRGVAAIKGNEFIFQSLKKMNGNGYWNQFSAGSTFDSINSNDLSKAVIAITSYEEQTQIGNFFKNLDRLITLHQRKVEKLGILKKAMLEKMFPKNGADVPEIRFKGFEGAWEEKTLGSVLTEMKRSIVLEDNKIYELVTVKRRNQGVVSRGLMKGKDILVKNYFEVREGDYIISKRQVIHGANGIVPQSLDRAIVSNEYLVSVGNENITAEYLTIISTLPDMYKKFFLSSYGVDIEKLVFDVEDWKKRPIVIPSLTEQKRITGFFKNLDKLLTLHQGELEKLKNLKKALLEKMFV